MSQHFSLVVDGQASVAWANVSIANGTASTTNFALHLLAGVGFGL